MHDPASQRFKAIVYEGGPFPGFIDRADSHPSISFGLGCRISYRTFGGSYIVEKPIDPDDDKGRAVWDGPDTVWDRPEGDSPFVDLKVAMDILDSIRLAVDDPAMTADAKVRLLQRLFAALDKAGAE
jgi:hypothetical protein